MVPVKRCATVTRGEGRVPRAGPLNSDTEVEPTAVERLLHAFDAASRSPSGAPGHAPTRLWLFAVTFRSSTFASQFLRHRQIFEEEPREP